MVTRDKNDKEDAKKDLRILFSFPRFLSLLNHRIWSRDLRSSSPGYSSYSVYLFSVLTRGDNSVFVRAD